MSVTVPDQRIDEAVASVGVELRRAMKAHKTGILSRHEGYAVILEELDEAWGIIKDRNAKECNESLHEELIQVAAMCLRTIIDLELDDQLPPAGEGDVQAAGVGEEQP